MIGFLRGFSGDVRSILVPIQVVSVYTYLRRSLSMTREVAWASAHVNQSFFYPKIKTIIIIIYWPICVGAAAGCL